jgi:hypothetical protein
MRKAFIVVFVALAGAGAWAQQQQARSAPCDPDNGGLTLPQGFCAKVVADGLGATRHIVVTPNGDIYTLLAQGGGPLAAAPTGPQPPAVIALRDTDGDGKYETQERFGPWPAGHGMALSRDNYLMSGRTRRSYDSNSMELRWRRRANRSDRRDLPRANPHSAKSIALGERASCSSRGIADQRRARIPDRRPNAAGRTRARRSICSAACGSTTRTRPVRSTSLRPRHAPANAHAGARVEPGRTPAYDVQNGRDQLDTLWSKNFTAEDNANRPAEEMHLLKQGANFGWPYVFYDLAAKKRILNPEYGGDGKAEGDCAISTTSRLPCFPAPQRPGRSALLHRPQFPADIPQRRVRRVPRLVEPRAIRAGTASTIRFVPFKGDPPSGRRQDLRERLRRARTVQGNAQAGASSVGHRARS